MTNTLQERLRAMSEDNPAYQRAVWHEAADALAAKDGEIALVISQRNDGAKLIDDLANRVHRLTAALEEIGAYARDAARRDDDWYLDLLKIDEMTRKALEGK